MNKAKAWFSKKSLKVVIGITTALLITMLLIMFWPAKNMASVPQEVVSTLNTSTPAESLAHDEEFFFQQPPYTNSNDIKPVEMVSKQTGIVTPIPEAIDFGGSIYEGNFGPVISRSGNHLAYRSQKDRAIVVMDTYGSRTYLPSQSIVDKETDVNTGIHEWSPAETKLMFTVTQTTTGCMGMIEMECVEPKGVPDDIRFGYHVADLTNGEVIFLGGVATSSYPYYFKGWIDDNTLLFEQENVLFEYDLRSSRLVRSLKFKEPGVKEIYHFDFVGMGAGNTQVYMYGTQIYSGSPMRLVARKGLSETVLTKFEWAQIQSRAVRISEDGRYVIWKVEGEDEERRFDLQTL